MVYRITGGLAFTLWGMSQLGVAIPPTIIAVLAIIAGIALLAGL